MHIIIFEISNISKTKFINRRFLSFLIEFIKLLFPKINKHYFFYLIFSLKLHLNLYYFFLLELRAQIYNIFFFILQKHL